MPLAMYVGYSLQRRRIFNHRPYNQWPLLYLFLASPCIVFAFFVALIVKSVHACTCFLAQERQRPCHVFKESFLLLQGLKQSLHKATIYLFLAIQNFHYQLKSTTNNGSSTIRESVCPSSRNSCAWP